jgi:hypothetical protein|tara:strand:- start:304 stop:492 length:189 start_codon:yes stop_codon:yes gene_type:complete
MIKALKSKLLTYLFTDWVKTETDLETLMVTKKYIKLREIEITGIKPVMGFRSHIAEEDQVNG